MVAQRPAEADLEMAEWLASDGPDRALLRRGLAAGPAPWKVEGRWPREAFLAPDPGPAVRHVRDRLVDEGRTMFGQRIERDAQEGRTVAGPPALIAKPARRPRTLTFADAYAEPGAFGEGSRSTPSRTRSCACSTAGPRARHLRCGGR